MQFATSGVQFSFDNNMYRQTDGVAMGSPLDQPFANIFVGFYERQIGRRSWPDMYARFVDDVFSHFPNKLFCDRFYERLNSLHPALRFTREEEQEGSLPFIIRTTNGMATSIYRKPTFTRLYTPWDSYSPTLYKVNLARSLCHRARRICSPAYLPAELQALRSILFNNGYPGHVLDTHITPLPRSNHVPPPSLGLDPVQLFSSFPGSATRVNSSIRRRTQLFVLRTSLLKSEPSSKHRRCSRCQKMFCLSSQTAMSFIFTNAGTAKAGMWVELYNASRTEQNNMCQNTCWTQLMGQRRNVARVVLRKFGKVRMNTSQQ